MHTQLTQMESQRAEAFRLKQEALNQKIASLNTQAETDIQTQEKLAENPVGNAINQAVGRENFNVGANLKRIEGVISTAKTLADNEQTNALAQIEQKVKDAETQATKDPDNATLGTEAYDAIKWAARNRELLKGGKIENLFLEIGIPRYIFSNYELLDDYMRKNVSNFQWYVHKDENPQRYIAIKQLIAANKETDQINSTKYNLSTTVEWALNNIDLPGVAEHLGTIVNRTVNEYSIKYIRDDLNKGVYKKDITTLDLRYPALKALMEAKTEVENINTSSQIPRSDALKLIEWALEHTNIPGVTDQLKAIDPYSSSSLFKLDYFKSRYEDPNILDLSKVDALDDKKYAALKALQEGKDAFKPFQNQIDQIKATLEGEINKHVLTFQSNKYLNSGLENARTRLDQLGVILQNSGDFVRTVLWGEAIATPVLIFGAFAAPFVGIPATVAVGGGALIVAAGVGIYKIIKALRNKVK